MSSILKKVALTAALTAASLSANAAQTDITVVATVDNNMTLLRADGSALPDSVTMSYNPVRGLSTWSEQVRIYSNDTTKDVQVRLTAPVELVPTNTSAGVPVPLTVSLKGQALSTTVKDFTAAELFDGAIPDASVAMELAIAQTTLGKIAAAGAYQGMASIVLNAKP
ncbi:CS1 type fimbrial major subunit [Stenotrophomonas rhizophila]|uniref:CS1 type fimbrial major subunit n=1 Tax=Stenotrophomonas rhizophila TaxID=216778 RepID=UPI0028CFFA35|nr:CS1 type fimbrial major subunit [Stenotrophomonas rhizophila]